MKSRYNDQMKGSATVKLTDGSVYEAEIHWFEAYSIGQKDLYSLRVKM